MAGLKESYLSQIFQSPTNVQDGIRAGNFQGGGFLGRGRGIYMGEVYPYSINPSINPDEVLLSDTIPANSTVYLPLGTIDFNSFPGYVTFIDNPNIPNGKCIKLDYERTLNLFVDNPCVITMSSMTRYFQKITSEKTFSGSTSEKIKLTPSQYINSIKIKNNSNSAITYALDLGLEFGIPYNMLYDPRVFTKMIVYDGFPLLTAQNIPSPISWFCEFFDAFPLPINATDPVPDITTGFTRPSINFEVLFNDGSPFQATPFNGKRILTIYTEHFGFGNLPPFENDPAKIGSWINGNSATILGATPYSENFQTWVN